MGRRVVGILIFGAETHIEFDILYFKPSRTDVIRQ